MQCNPTVHVTVDQPRDRALHRFESYKKALNQYKILQKGTESMQNPTKRHWINTKSYKKALNQYKILQKGTDKKALNQCKIL
jgi:hypothetical protein